MFATHQCSRNVCKNADNPSISTKIARVKIAQNMKTTTKARLFIGNGNLEPNCRPLRITIVHNTSDSSIAK